MTKPRRARTAKLAQVLVYYDQPQVAYLDGDRGFKIMAVAVESRRRMALPYFCSEVSDNLFHAYLTGRVDLNFVLRQGKKNRYSFFDWASSEDGETFSLDAATVADIEDEDNYPQPGFFSENHTHKYKDSALVHPARLAFNIDGKWDAADFSRFVGRVDEIYLFSRLVETRDVNGQALTIFLKKEIEPRAWMHGGDYTQFYRSLKGKSQASEALRVERIAYNSPGQIVVRGEQEALREVADIVQAYKENSDSAHNRYLNLRRFLTREGFLSRGGEAPAISDGISKLVIRLTTELLQSIGMQNGGRLLDACNYNPVVFAKVTMSLIRRVKDAAGFYAEGRVSSDRFVESLNP